MKRCVIVLIFSLSCWSAAAAGGEYRPEVRSKVVLQSSTTASGQPIVYPRADRPQVTASTVEISPGGETYWHTHPFPLYAWVVAGTLTVEFEGGKKLLYREGDAIIEAVNVPQNGRNSGSTPVKLLVFATGAEEVPTAVKTLVYEPGPAGRGPGELPKKEELREKPVPPPEKKEEGVRIRLNYKEPVIE